MTAASAIPPDARTRRAFSRDLFSWFARARRSFPWRRNRTAYRVWISELMLQQTRADQARPYFDRFVRRFPSVRALAEAPLQDVLKLWEGLGYYARARNAHRTARHLAAGHRGRFPRTLEGLRALPGVGPYTAAAVGSLAFGLDAAVVDGNVIRVLSRVFAVGSDPRSPATRRVFQSLADHLLTRGRAGEFNEAMMELGATVCLPRGPRCGECPLARVCAARARGAPEQFPARRSRRKLPHKEVAAGVIVNDRDEVLLAQRPAGGMLGGLWEFPGGTRERGETMPDCLMRELREELGIETRVGPRIRIVSHAFSHFTMRLHAYWVRVTRGRPRPIQCDAVRWVKRRDLRKYPFPRADLEILDAVLAARPWPRF